VRWGGGGRKGGEKRMYDTIHPTLLFVSKSDTPFIKTIGGKLNFDLISW